MSLGSRDLRGEVRQRGGASSDPLFHNPEVYYRQACHHASRTDPATALLYLALAMEHSSEVIVLCTENPNIFVDCFPALQVEGVAAVEFTGLGGRIMATQARALSCLGDFHLSQQSAEAVLRLDPRCVQAVWIRAESLYNNCQFERAMSVFCRGLRYTIMVV